MIKKEDYQCWERFVLAVRQGKSAAVQSDERREAILAIAEFVEDTLKNGEEKWGREI